MNIETVLGDKSGADVLARMTRTLERLRKARDFDDMRDHAVAFCIDAWHVHEWAWAEVCRDLSFKTQLAQETGQPLRDVSKSSVAKWADEKIGGRLLHVCQIIATETKHTTSEHFELAELVVYGSAASCGMLDGSGGFALEIVQDGEADDFALPPGSAPPRPPTSGDLGRALGMELIESAKMRTALQLRVTGEIVFEGVELQPAQRLKLRINGERLGAVESFETVLSFWQSFFSSRSHAKQVSPSLA